MYVTCDGLPWSGSEEPRGHGILEEVHIEGV